MALIFFASCSLSDNDCAFASTTAGVGTGTCSNCDGFALVVALVQVLVEEHSLFGVELPSCEDRVQARVLLLDELVLGDSFEVPKDFVLQVVHV